MKEFKPRELRLSDFATEDEAEIKKNPYTVFDLPEGTPFQDVRRVYIARSKVYHPDLVNPRLDYSTLDEIYNPEELSETLGLPFEEFHKKLEENLEEKVEEVERVKDKIRVLAHRKMVRLNRAYDEIKSRISPKVWQSVAGYEFRRVVDKNEGQLTGRVNLEGDGEVVLYSYHYDYWTAGSYLCFDYGPEEDSLWLKDNYQTFLNIKHLFAFWEIQEGRPLNKVLLEPFFDCFKLTQDQVKLLMSLLSSRRSTQEIMVALGVPAEDEIPVKQLDRYSYSLGFRRQINEILSLSTEPDWLFKPMVKLEMINGKLFIEAKEKNVFSEPDFNLFLTLAYGPLLT